MATANTCIICGQKAGSREHIFPAAFGGRRKDKGIYCGNHKNEFGRHVAALLAELDIFNALLGVRPDRQDTVRAAPATLSDGSKEQSPGSDPSQRRCEFPFGKGANAGFPESEFGRPLDG